LLEEKIEGLQKKLQSLQTSRDQLDLKCKDYDQLRFQSDRLHSIEQTNKKLKD